MRILLCIDYSSFTEKMLDAVRTFVDGLKNPEINVLHIIDEQLFFPTTGYETQLNETLQDESKELKELCIQYLGAGFNYIEEYGIPGLRLDEALTEISYDLLIAGSHSRHGLGERLVGSIAEHLLRNSRKPILIIP